MATRERVNGQRSLAGALGVSLGFVAKLKKSGVISEVAGEEGVFDLDLARRALAAHRRGGANEASAQAHVAGAVPRFAIPPPISLNELTAGRTPPQGGRSSDGDREILESAGDPLEAARAAARVASRELARAIGSPLVADQLESLKRSLDGLRLYEADALELATKREELVPREVLRALGGTLGQRAASLFDRVSVRLPTRIEEWIGDEAFLGATTEERARLVREWWSALARSARTVEADEVESAIAAVVADSKDG